MPCGVKVDGIEFCETALVDRPDHAAVLGRIFTSWSLIESSITAILGLMMHNDHRAALAVLESFKSNSSRVTAVRRIGKEVLEGSVGDDFEKLMNEVLEYAKDRNQIAHGLWGAHKDYPDVIYQMPIKNFSGYLVKTVGSTQVNADEDLKYLNNNVRVYTLENLERLEKKGVNILYRVMSKMTEKAYLRKLSNIRTIS